MLEKYREYIHGDKAEIPYGVTSIEEYAFSDCTALISIEIPNSVTTIERFAFKGCSNLAYIEIPDSVTVIGEMAFYGCGLTEIEIPYSVNEIKNPFSGCNNLTSIIVQEGNPSFVSKNNCILDRDSETVLYCGCKESIIPGSVTEIKSGAFEESGLTSISIPNSVKIIGKGAFARCRSLESVRLPNDLTKISDSAFSSCSGLTSIEIPNSVKIIGRNAFWGCSSLVSIKIPDGVERIGDQAFCNSGLVSITIPNSVVEIGNGAFFFCFALAEVRLQFQDPSKAYDVYRKASSLREGEITLYTPIGSGYAYRHFDYFKQFKEIKPVL